MILLIIIEKYFPKFLLIISVVWNTCELNEVAFLSTDLKICNLMWRLWDTRTSDSLSAMSGARTRYVILVFKFHNNWNFKHKCEIRKILLIISCFCDCYVHLVSLVLMDGLVLTRYWTISAQQIHKLHLLATFWFSFSLSI